MKCLDVKAQLRLVIQINLEMSSLVVVYLHVKLMEYAPVRVYHNVLTCLDTLRKCLLYPAVLGMTLELSILFSNEYHYFERATGCLKLNLLQNYPFF